MMTDFPPAALLILGALLVPFFRGQNRSWYVIFIPAGAFLLIANLEPGSSWQVPFLGYELTFLRVDKLSKVFGYIFTLNAFAAFVYAFYLRDATQHMAAWCLPAI
jgi:multicomponent Na+:H+ antiporter subunit D